MAKLGINEWSRTRDLASDGNGTCLCLIGEIFFTYIREGGGGIHLDIFSKTNSNAISTRCSHD